MTDQVVANSKRQPTVRALEWPLPGVSSHVSFEGVLGREGKRATLAREWTLARVTSHVPVQVVTPGEQCEALLALEALVARVRLHRRIGFWMVDVRFSCFALHKEIQGFEEKGMIVVRFPVCSSFSFVATGA